MQNDCTDPEVNIHRLDELLDILDDRFDKTNDDDEGLKIWIIS